MNRENPTQRETRTNVSTAPRASDAAGSAPPASQHLRGIEGGTAKSRTPDATPDRAGVPDFPRAQTERGLSLLMGGLPISQYIIHTSVTSSK